MCFAWNIWPSCVFIHWLKRLVWGLLRRVSDCSGNCLPHPWPCSSVQPQVLLLYKLGLIWQLSHSCQELSVGHIPNWVEEEFLAFFSHCLPRALNSSGIKKKETKENNKKSLLHFWCLESICNTSYSPGHEKKRRIWGPQEMYLRNHKLITDTPACAVLHLTLLVDCADPMSCHPYPS